MIRLKKRNVRLRMAKSMRPFARVKVLVKAFAFTSVPQPAAGQLDEHVLERRCEHFQALQFVIFSFQAFNQRDDRLWGMRGMQDVISFELAAVGHSVEACE